MTDRAITTEEAEIFLQGVVELSKGQLTTAASRFEEFTGTHQNTRAMVYALLCGLAEATREEMFPGRPPYGFSVLKENRAVNPDEEFDPGSDNALTVWCVRFCAANANGDTDTRLALFNTIENEAEAASLVAEFMMIAARVLQGRMARLQAEQP